MRPVYNQPPDDGGERRSRVRIAIGGVFITGTVVVIGLFVLAANVVGDCEGSVTGSDCGTAGFGYSVLAVGVICLLGLFGLAVLLESRRRRRTE